MHTNKYNRQTNVPIDPLIDHIFPDYSRISPYCKSRPPHKYQLCFAQKPLTFKMLTLIPGRHILCMDDEGKVQKDEKGNFYILDIIDNQLCMATDCEDLRNFFNIPLDEYPSTPSSESTDVLEKPLSVQEADNPTVPVQLVQVPIKSKSQETAVKWKDENAVKLLIKLWQDHESLFKSSTMKNAEVWRLISEGLRKMNPNWIFNAIQCENKFKDLRRHYMATKDHNSQTGVQPKTCKFYNEMEEVLGMKPNVKPVAIASSLKRRSSALQSDCSTPQSGETSTEAYDSSESVDQEIKVEKKEKNIKKRTRMERQLEAWSLANQAEVLKREEAREKRHQESMEKKERAIKAYESFMTKLLDKL